MCRGCYAHSPESWTALWKRVFAEVESPEFAQNRVFVTAELVDHWGRDEIVVHSVTVPQLFWSVEIL